MYCAVKESEIAILTHDILMRIKTRISIIHCMLSRYSLNSAVRSDLKDKPAIHDPPQMFPLPFPSRLESRNKTTRLDWLDWLLDWLRATLSGARGF